MTLIHEDNLELTKSINCYGNYLEFNFPIANIIKMFDYKNIEVEIYLFNTLIMWVDDGATKTHINHDEFVVGYFTIFSNGFCDECITQIPILTEYYKNKTKSGEKFQQYVDSIIAPVTVKYYLK